MLRLIYGRRAGALCQFSWKDQREPERSTASESWRWSNRCQGRPGAPTRSAPPPRAPPDTVGDNPERAPTAPSPPSPRRCC
ncbi:hypothetical protein AV530_019019 [Patagioenas fasciata monilis]|uniref:Uncharacterized protein n=1 Tax=Patagioenas fasciata monilis TaxID=372326 RepID=A0A1V4KWY9_PATFA|nr:hypothetical protein AV530_019019 [Patagioenas fasciata monilis]